jgi:hypothetical protein
MVTGLLLVEASCSLPRSGRFGRLKMSAPAKDFSFSFALALSLRVENSPDGMEEREKVSLGRRTQQSRVESSL